MAKNKMTIKTIAKFIWEPVSLPFSLIGVVAVVVLLFCIACYFIAAGVFLCVHLEWFDWKFSLGFIWMIPAAWIVFKIIHKFPEQ